MKQQNSQSSKQVVVIKGDYAGKIGTLLGGCGLGLDGLDNNTVECSNCNDKFYRIGLHEGNSVAIPTEFVLIIGGSK